MNKFIYNLVNDELLIVSNLDIVILLLIKKICNHFPSN